MAEKKEAAKAVAAEAADLPEVSPVAAIVAEIKALSIENQFEFYIQCNVDVQLWNIVNGAAQYQLPPQ